MSATDTLENELLLLIFNNDTTTIGIGAGATANLQGSTTDGEFYVALHTAQLDSPAESPANQTVNEATYPGYARVKVERVVSGSPSGWTVSGSTVSNTAELSFNQHSGGTPATETVTHFSVSNGTGSSDVLFFGPLTASLQVSSGVTPRFAAGALQISLD